MKNASRISVLFPLLASFAITNSALGIEEHLVSPDQTKAHDISLDPGEVTRGYFHSGRSYECRISLAQLSETTDDFVHFNPIITGPEGAVSVVPVGNIYPSEAAVSGVSISEQSARRIAFIPNATGIYVFQLDFDAGLNANGTVDCFETTLLGSFNTFFAAVPITELRNRGNRAISVNVKAINFSGTTVAELNSSVPASSRTDVILNIGAQQYGKITVTYLAPRGALEGTVAEYNYMPDGSIQLKRERSMNLSTVIP